MRELLLASLLTSASAGGSTPCVACGLVVTLVLERRQLCSVEDANCHAAAMELKKLAPDEVCKLLGICPHNSSCTLWPDSEWPPASLPPQPPHDPPNLRRRLADGGDALQRLARALAGVFQTRSSKQQEGFLAMSETVYDVLGIGNTQMGLEAAAQTAVSSGLPKTHPCAPLNVSCIIDRFANQHLPIFDRDVDAFSSQEHRGLRGSHWRGADCDDGDPAVYPGRRTPPSNDSSVDHDCNGIAGSNASNGVPYEELLCAGTERRGLIHIGDSATAHFHLPPSWLTAQGWSGLNNGRADAIDELDWPACAWGTGFKNASDCPPTANASLAALPSLAARLRLRNRCNHRDFQNIGVNGARVTGILPSIASAARSAALDHPALVVFSLIGNDVCNGHADTIAHMTTPAEFRNKRGAGFHGCLSLVERGGASDAPRQKRMPRAFPRAVQSSCCPGVHKLSRVRSHTTCNHTFSRTKTPPHHSTHKYLPISEAGRRHRVVVSGRLLLLVVQQLNMLSSPLRRGGGGSLDCICSCCRLGHPLARLLMRRGSCGRATRLDGVVRLLNLMTTHLEAAVARNVKSGTRVTARLWLQRDDRPAAHVDAVLGGAEQPEQH